jgi:PAS domain S-box-containing protein
MEVWQSGEADAVYTTGSGHTSVMTDAHGATPISRGDLRARPIVVGLGASAGGIRTLKEFFAQVEPGSGIAYVVILHLSPDYESKLAEVLQVAARIPVAQVTGPVDIEPDRVYVVPQSKSLQIHDMRLDVTEVTRPEQRRSPVDLFFRDLADAHGPRSVCVVLSGTGPNGSAGLKRVKAYGGLVIAQDPNEAEYQDMPRHAIETNQVDLVLPVAQIPARIAAFARNPGPVVPEGDAGIAGAARPGGFFRDADAFSAIEQRIIPRLFVNKQPHDQIRVWVAGCATGEEAYTLAILLAEHSERLTAKPAIQVFATDLDEHAIAIAREGLYGEADVAGLSERRRQRFFAREASRFRVRRELRELLLFAHHDMLRDPPFSHLDLISCCNLLIHLTRSAQERLIEAFHFALRPGAYLFLGASETPDGTNDLFFRAEPAVQVYQSRGATSRLSLPRHGDAPFPPPRMQANAGEPRSADRIPPAELHLRLLEQYAAPSLAIDEDHSLVHISERATRYLQIAPGEPSRDLFRLIRPELRSGLRSALHQAVKQRITIDVHGLRVGGENGGHLVNLTVRPVLREGEPIQGFFLVMFEPAGQTDGARALSEDDRVRVSATLMSATDIGSIFLDRKLRVKLFTPKAREVFNLLDSDIGRPLSDITSKLRGVDIHADVKDVLDRLQNVEREVQTADDRWHLVRVLPYRTTDNRIDGVVVTFQDITARRNAEQHVRQSEERLRALFESATDYAIFTLNEQGAIDSWSPGAERMFGYEANEVIGQHFDLLFIPEDRAEDIPERELTQARAHRRAADERYHVRKDGTRFYCSGVTTRLGDGGIGFAKIARDLTESEQAKADLERARAELERRVELRTAELAREVRGHAAANTKVMDLLRRVVSTEDVERRRISHELHDDIGQQLTGLRLALEREQASSRDSNLGHALELTLSISRAINFIAWQLRPAVLDELGLAAALPRFVNSWSAQAGIRADCRVERYGAGMLSADAEVTFYRIVQEALHNVAKHARARRADVVLTVRDGQVVLIVEDDGAGFDVLEILKSNEGLGLVGMRERAALVHATLQVESAPGNGTSVFLRCPAAPPPASPQDGGS